MKGKYELILLITSFEGLYRITTPAIFIGNVKVVD
jgi:hypothetical protein